MHSRKTQKRTALSVVFCYILAFKNVVTKIRNSLEAYLEPSQGSIMKFFAKIFTGFPAGTRRCDNVGSKQRCHNVVFATSLLRPKSNVVKTSCFQRQFSDQILTL